MWKDMFAGAPTGTLNRVLSLCFGFLGFEPIDWLGNPATVMAGVIIPGIWAGAGVGSLIYLAALKSVPEELYEAAAIDGAPEWQVFLRISLPRVKPILAVNVLHAFLVAYTGWEWALIRGGG
jgi:multiple sugar transport system permease protein